MVLAATAHDRLAGVLLNDIGPELAPEGLANILTYLGVPPKARSYAEVVGAAQDPHGRLPRPLRRQAHEPRQALVRPGRRRAPAQLRPAHPRRTSRRPPASPPPTCGRSSTPSPASRSRWCAAPTPTCSTPETVARMRERRPDLIVAEVPDRGHVPFLDEPEALAALDALLARVGRMTDIAAIRAAAARAARHPPHAAPRRPPRLDRLAGRRRAGEGREPAGHRLLQGPRRLGGDLGPRRRRARAGRPRLFLRQPRPGRRLGRGGARAAGGDPDALGRARGEDRRHPRPRRRGRALRPRHPGPRRARRRAGRGARPDPHPALRPPAGDRRPGHHRPRDRRPGRRGRRDPGGRPRLLRRRRPQRRHRARARGRGPRPPRPHRRAGGLRRHGPLARRRRAARQRPRHRLDLRRHPDAAPRRADLPDPRAPRRPRPRRHRRGGARGRGPRLPPPAHRAGARRRRLARRRALPSGGEIAGDTVICVASGGNVDPALFARTIAAA